MKIIITESQSSTLNKLRRRVSKLKNLLYFNLSNRYDPCDYAGNEDSVYDFYVDLKNDTIGSFINSENLGDSDKEFDEVFEAMSEFVFDNEFENVRNYFNDYVSSYCSEKAVDK